MPPNAEGLLEVELSSTESPIRVSTAKVVFCGAGQEVEVMKFLLTNDDGIEARGLVALARAVEPLGSIVVVAPDRHLSGCSHQATTSRPLELVQLASGWYSVDGSPADCTRVGLIHVAPEIDWVLSGVNEGGNLGADVFLSGTVAAAREACLLGKPAMAISQYVRTRPIDWDQATRWARGVIELLLEKPPVPGRFWNVNLPQPDSTGGQMPPIVHCPVDPHPLPVNFEVVDGKLHYRGRYQDRKQTAGHDVETCFAGQIAVSQIGLHWSPPNADEVGTSPAR
jgi:5'-nucleotidase